MSHSREPEVGSQLWLHQAPALEAPGRDEHGVMAVANGTPTHPVTGMPAGVEPTLARDDVRPCNRASRALSRPFTDRPRQADPLPLPTLGITSAHVRSDDGDLLPFARFVLGRDEMMRQFAFAAGLAPAVWGVVAGPGVDSPVGPLPM